MLSSISSSDKPYVVRILLFFILIMSAYLAINIAGFKLDPDLQSSKIIPFSNDVTGKSKLLEKFASTTPPDVIFIGSSTTKYNVSTDLFKSGKMRIFNYGLESHFFTAYPSMIEAAIQQHPKVIVLSLDSPEFYYPLLSVEAAFNKEVNITLTNLEFFIEHYLRHFKNTVEIKLILRLLDVYFQQLNYFTLHGHKIADAIKHFHERWNPVTLPVEEKKEVATLESDRAYLDCKPMGSVTPTGFACSNGDGVLIGHEKNIPYENFNKRTEYADEKYNAVFVSIINDMLDKIRKAGIKPMVVFIPQFEYSAINPDLMRKTVKADIVDMTQFRVPKDAWYNSGHLNAKGRYLYSKALVSAFLVRGRDSHSITPDEMKSTFHPGYG